MSRARADHQCGRQRLAGRDHLAREVGSRAAAVEWLPLVGLLVPLRLGQAGVRREVESRSAAALPMDRPSGPVGGPLGEGPHRAAHPAHGRTARRTWRRSGSERCDRVPLPGSCPLSSLASSNGSAADDGCTDLAAQVRTTTSEGGLPRASRDPAHDHLGASRTGSNGRSCKEGLGRRLQAEFRLRTYGPGAAPAGTDRWWGQTREASGSRSPGETGPGPIGSSAASGRLVVAGCVMPLEEGGHHGARHQPASSGSGGVASPTSA
jgi:hypothetical protein